MYYLKNVRFTVPHTGEEIFFEEGDVKGFYDIINWQINSNGEIHYVTVGHYDGSAAPENRMHIMTESIVWHNEVLEVSNTLINTWIKQQLTHALLDHYQLIIVCLCV